MQGLNVGQLRRALEQFEEWDQIRVVGEDVLPSVTDADEYFVEGVDVSSTEKRCRIVVGLRTE